jgi:hypothetical protein
VNLAGPDFGTQVPGVLGTDYLYPTTDEIDYFVARGMNVFRFPFLWERGRAWSTSAREDSKLPSHAIGGQFG